MASPPTNLANAVDPLAGQQTGKESSLSTWAGPLVTDVLGRAEALSQEQYQPYTGPLTAGSSALQEQAFSGLAGLTIPTGTSTTYTPGTFTAQSAEQYMSPYLQAALNPQIAEARRQAEISRLNQMGRLSKAGAYGGGRQAILEAELERGLGSRLSDITGRGYQTAYEQAMRQFNTEQERQQAAARQAQQYGLEALRAQLGGGETQRGIEQTGITADIAEFEKQREFPYKQVSWLKEMLGGLPIASQTMQYQQPSTLGNIFGIGGGLLTLLEGLGLTGGGTNALQKKAASTTGNTGSTNTTVGDMAVPRTESDLTQTEPPAVDQNFSYGPG